MQDERWMQRSLSRKLSREDESRRTRGTVEFLNSAEA